MRCPDPQPHPGPHIVTEPGNGTVNTIVYECPGRTHPGLSLVAERANREGDTQPLPVGNDLPIAHIEVMNDLEERLKLGIKRYGQPLQPFNGRKPLRDAYEEALDQCVYLWCALYEQEHPR